MQTFNCSGDSGMLVHVKTTSGAHVAAYYNDDVSSGGGGTGPKSSFINTGTRTGAYDYDIYVFSQERATAYCSVWFSENYGTWTFWTSERFGGTLVDVGPLRTSDFIEVQTHGNGLRGTDIDDTRMVLFDLGTSGCTGANGAMCTTTNAPLFVDNPSSTDKDPRIPAFSSSALPSGFGSTRNLVLVGKVSRTSSSNEGVETRADLIRGPLDADFTEVSGMPTSGGTGPAAAMLPGRYYVWLYAKTSAPVSSHTAVPYDETWPSGMMRDAGAGTCLTGVSGDSTNQPAWYYRGAENDVAFRMLLQRGDGCSGTSCSSWSTVGTRWVPRAAVAAEPNSLNLFLMELKLDSAGVYRLSTDFVNSTITFFNAWKYSRNPDASELKLVSINNLYEGDYAVEKFRNASNLLATRGHIDTSNFSITEPDDQAPYQWEADIIGFQEMEFSCDPNAPMLSGTDCNWDYNQFRYADIFVDEAHRKGSILWKYVRGEAEDYDLSDDMGLAPLFINQLAWPDPKNSSSLYFSLTDKRNASCGTEGSHGLAEWFSCHLPGNGEWQDMNQWAVGGMAAARRYGSSADRPIAVFNLHLEADTSRDKYPDQDDRYVEMTRLIEHIELLMKSRPSAFNVQGNTSPMHFSNRFIILGDLNLRQHECGESYALVRLLRERFGYALDLGMASINPQSGQSFSNMHHWKGSSYDSAGVPQSFLHYTDWRDACDANPAAAHSITSDYPWWAATYRGKTGTSCHKSERHDVFLLVGRGWAYDDPLLSYTVMSDADAPSPMHPGGGGVEMWSTGTAVTDGTFNGRPNYRPNHRVGTTPPGPGTPALHSDHTPVGARIRIFVR